MEAIRKVILNQEDIIMAKQYNTAMKAEYVGSGVPVQLTPIPEPIYSTQRFSFRLDLVTNFYVERDTLNGKEDGDIIINLMYEGVVKLQYDPIVLQTLDIMLNKK